MKKLTMDALEMAGRRVFVRVDFNVPLKDGVVQEDTRIRATLPTLKRALDVGARLVLGSHLGRPKGRPRPELSLAPVAERLSEHLGKPVRFCGQTVGDAVDTEVGKLANGEMLLLENLRFSPGETDNDADFARRLSTTAELYVNDAFGTAHRAHASTQGMVRYFEQAAAGTLMEKELHYLDMALTDPPRPFTAMLGGAKVSDKIKVVRSLLEKVDRLLVGGGMAYTFLRAQGLPTGKSLVEEDKIELAKSLLEEAGDKLVLPLDHIVAAKFDPEAEHRVMPIGEIPDGWMGLDIGPKTVAAYGDQIRAAKMILWNGPMGVFEMEPFAKGTVALAEVIAASDGTSVVGGGDSVAAVHKAGVADRITHISTGGGASLEFLAGAKLPGVEVLTDA
ncbi:MAG: phosphoglycerate kinase [Deltaproteobacteria bacterium]|nr:phosphoglycerate kinase [Deltaproteobacteria bacterium]